MRGGAIIVMTTNVGTDAIAALEGADDALLDAEAATPLCGVRWSGQSLQDAVVEAPRRRARARVRRAVENRAPRQHRPLAARRRRPPLGDRPPADRARRPRGEGRPARAPRGYRRAARPRRRPLGRQLGGRSTRDYIEEHVVEAVAEALDGAPKVLDGATPIEAELDVVGKRQQVPRLDGEAGGAEASEYF